MRIFLSSTLITVFLCSCGDPAEKGKKQRAERISVEISESDIYATNKILAFLENTTKFVEEANAFFLMGVDSYRNKKDLDSATVYFKKSILKEPSAKAYFELGNVYFDKKKFADAEKAYGMAEKLDYQPFSKILYNKACMYSMKDEPELAGQYLEYAIQAGYINLDHMEKDPDLENVRETYYFRKAIEKGLRGMSNAEDLYWLQFKKQFQKIDLPTKLKTTLSEQDYEQLQFISYDYEKYIAEMRDEEFSRDVSKGFYYYTQPYETKEYVAIVYIVKDEFMGEYAPLLYRLATFTHDGQLIDKRVIAGREVLEGDLWEATLKKNGVIDIVIKEPVYEKDPVEHGYWDNPMKSSKELGRQRMVIRQNGKITIDEALASNN